MHRVCPSGLLNEWAGCGRLDRPPREHCYLRFPESFGRRFVVFIDTEEEFDWSQPLRRENRSTSAMKALPAMQDRLRACGVKPVYLVDHPIATDAFSIGMLRDWMARDECTIGTQLHPWVNPPFDEEVNPFNSFTGNLPIGLQRAKLEVLTETIEKAFGRRPTVYRAGRYGVGEHTAELLEEAGYQADVSVRALFDYSAGGGPNFEQVRPQPHWIGDGKLLEVPLSAAFTGRLWKRGDAIFRRTRRMPNVRAALARAGLLSRVALTPEDMPLYEVMRATRNLLADGAQLLSFSFHSPSVEPGHTPYVRTARDLKRFHGWWSGLFNFLARRNIRPASIEEVLAAAAESRTRAGV